MAVDQAPTTTAHIVIRDPAQARTVDGLLRQHGLNPVWHADAESSLRGMNEGAVPALVVADLHLPVIDGLRFLRILRSEAFPHTQGIPVVLVTTSAVGAEADAVTRDSSDVAFFRSPLDERRFADHVSAVLRGDPLAVAPGVLIAEGRETADRLKEELADRGYRVDVAATVREGRHAIERDEFEIAIVAQAVSGEDGGVLLDYLRLRQPRCACIILAREFDGDTILAWMKRGASACVTTPIDPAVLVAQCQQVRRERALVHPEALLDARNLELRRSEDTFRSVVAASPMGVYLYRLEPDGRLVLEGANPAADRLTGVPNGPRVGLTIEEAFPALTDTEIPERYRRAARDGEAWHTEQITYNHGGIAGAFEVYAFQVSAGRMAVLFEEITERKRAEVALRESEEKLATLFDSMTELVALHEVVFDETGRAIDYRITDCNRAYTQVTGISKEVAVGRSAREVYGTATPPFLDEYTRVSTTGEPFVFETYYAPMKKYFSISVVSPGPGRFATVTTDITSARLAERVIAAKNEELEQIVYVASHDLRSPLVNVDGYSREVEYAIEAITKAFEGSQTHDQELGRVLAAELPDIASALRHVRRSAKQMDALLKGLLKLSRSGRAALTFERLDMNALVARVASSVDYLRRELGADVRIDDLPPCRGDAIQVSQVFANLIGNALKYLSPDRAGVIRISGGVVGDHVVYCVEDNGIGIAPEHQARVFELFHRLDPSASEGEGLGLTIVKRILDRLDGRVRLESVPGEGSRFFIDLPIAPAE